MSDCVEMGVEVVEELDEVGRLEGQLRDAVKAVVCLLAELRGCIGEIQERATQEGEPDGKKR